jgi:integrase
MRQGDLFKTPRGTNFASVIEAYRFSPKFQARSRATKVSYEYAFRIAKQPEALGNISVKEIRPALVQAFLDGFADHPATQRNVRSALLALEKWAMVRDLLPRSITANTEAIRTSESYEPWSDEHIKIAEQWARPDLARLVTLAAGTGQRGSDLVRMRWTDLETHDGVEGIRVVTQKTRRTLWIALPAEILAWERSLSFIAPRFDGVPFTRAQLSTAWNYEREHNPHLVPHKELGLSFHGLRASAVIRLRLQNIEPTLIANVIGMSVQMVENYSKKANQIAAALKVRARTGGEQNNVVPLPKRPLSS